MKTILLSFILTSTAMALITPDSMQTGIIRSYKKNIIAINRGLEDGIFKGSHIKLTNDEGFIARGICLKSNMTFSYLKVYRIVRPELVSFDSLYDLKDIHQSEIPDDLKYLKDALLPYDLKEINPSELKKELVLQQERIVKFDLPSSIAQAKKNEKSETEAFLIKNLNYTQLKKDLSNIDLQFFASPYQTQSISGETNGHIGLQINNSGEKYEYTLRHEQMRTQIISPFTKENLKRTSSFTHLFFDIKRINEKWSYFLYLQRETDRIGRINNPKERLSYGLFGFKYHLIDPIPDTENLNGIKKLDLSYIPLFESYTFDSFQDGRSLEGGIQSESTNYLRHAFRVRAQGRISKKSTLNLLAWWRPQQKIDSGSFDLANNLTDINMTFSTELHKALFFDYSLRYLYDINNEEAYGVSASNIISSLALRLNLGLNL